MLPTSHSQAYHNLLNKILTLQSLLNQLPLNPDQIEESLQQLEQVFQEQVIALTPEELELGIVSRWQSVQTEIHRTFRLLRTDVLLWRAGKQATTKTQRLKVIGNRLEQLIDYCRIMQV
jgi:uncharacterized coiled-coil DUF342 family protein